MRLPPEVSSESGFTLLEIIVTVVIFSLLTLAVVVGYPAQRNHERLLVAERLVQSLAREAYEMSLNEDRSSQCLNILASNEPLSCLDAAGEQNAQRCSDVGIMFPQNSSEVLLMADINRASSTGYGLSIASNSRDCVIRRVALPPGVVTTGGPRWYVFTSAPPASTEIKPNTNSPFSLKAGALTRTWRILNYGQLL